jgi:RNA polymerase sigma factor (sigma-70 family)
MNQPPREISEHEMIRRYREGDRYIFEHIYYSYREYISVIFSRRFKLNGTDSLELMHETFTRLFSAECRRSFEGEGRFEAYLSSIATNIGIEFMKSDDRDKAHGYDNLLMLKKGEEIPIEETLHKNHLQELISRFLESLENEEKEFYISYYDDRLTLEQMVKKYKISMWRLRRKLKGIRKNLKKYLRKNGII